MDDVVRHSGVVRLLGEYLFEDRARLQLVGVGLVGRGGGGFQGEGIEDRRLIVVRIARVQTLHAARGIVTGAACVTCSSSTTRRTASATSRRVRSHTR